MAAEEQGLKYAEEFAAIAAELQQEPGQQPTLERITELAVETIAPCEDCGVSLRDRSGQITTPASTGPLVTLADAWQYELNEGPCLEAIWTLETCLIEDMDTDRRWPRWAAQASELGFKSVLSIRLEPPRGHRHAALNLYASKAYAFDDITDHAIASVFARHAANALGAAEDRESLTDALRSRLAIGIAEGMLMQRFGLTLDQSFELLRRYSQAHNVKLRVLAENLVQSGGILQVRPGATQTADDLLEAAFRLDEIPGLDEPPAARIDTEDC